MEQSYRVGRLLGLAVGILSLLSLLVGGVRPLVSLPAVQAARGPTIGQSSSLAATFTSSGLSSTSAYYVSTTGNDASPGTETQPFRTIGRAAALVKPGGTVYIRAGTYREQVAATTSGSASSPITFRNYGTDQVVIDEECLRAHGFQIAASWITVQGFTITRTVEASVVMEPDGSGTPRPSNVTIDGMKLLNFDCQELTQDSFRAGVASRYGGSHITITNNLIQRRTSGEPRGYADGIWFKSNDSNPSGGGHYIAGNTIIGGWDGIGGEEEGSAHGSFDGDTTIANNTVRDCADDGIQVEGGDNNVHVSGNDISGCGAGIAFAAPIVGPLYVENNYIHDLVWGWWTAFFCFKVGNYGGGLTYLTGNICDVDSPAEQAQEGGADAIQQTNYGLSPIVSRNNVFHVSRYVMELWEWPRPAGESFDSDCMTTTDASRFIKWGSASGTAYYTSLASFQAATGQERSGRQSSQCQTDPNVDSDGDSLGVMDSQGRPVFRDAVELLIGTDPKKACSAPGQDAWPPDLSRDDQVDVLDLLLFKGRLGAAEGDTNYSRRFDLNADHTVNVLDMLMLRPFLGRTCNP